MRTYLYKLTSDRGGAPCAPPPRPGEDLLLTLSICKPAIRRTAQPGDRILGITSHTLARNEGYPLLSVIYVACVTGALEPREYYAAQNNPFSHRPDCIYEFHQRNGKLAHNGRTPLHADTAYEARDVGRYPYYRNARTLLSTDFRYFGADAVAIPARCPLLLHAAEALGQGHRVFDEGSAEAREADALFKLLWKRPTGHTPAQVLAEARGHAPRRAK
jgi:hypothetical protein